MCASVLYLASKRSPVPTDVYSAITKLTEKISGKQAHGALRRFAEGSQDASDILACYRDIAFLFDHFQVSIIYAHCRFRLMIDNPQLDTSLSIERNTEDIKRNLEHVERDTKNIMSVGRRDLSGHAARY